MGPRGKVNMVWYGQTEEGHLNKMEDGGGREGLLGLSDT